MLESTLGSEGSIERVRRPFRKSPHLGSSSSKDRKEVTVTPRAGKRLRVGRIDRESGGTKAMYPEEIADGLRFLSPPTCVHGVGNVVSKSDSASGELSAADE